ncbi:MAG: hypothetical protein J5529_03150 [Prevotella sp.]|nr:hypothetical protein [Prevotella sp.]
MSTNETSLVILTILAAFILFGGLSLMVACFHSLLTRNGPVNEAAHEVDGVEGNVTDDDENEIQVRASIQILADSQRKAKNEEAGRERNDREPNSFQPSNEFSANHDKNST